MSEKDRVLHINLKIKQDFKEIKGQVKKHTYKVKLEKGISKKYVYSLREGMISSAKCKTYMENMDRFASTKIWNVCQKLLF